MMQNELLKKIEQLCPYPMYWPGQKEIIRSIYNGFLNHKFIALISPTGTGKSLIATIVSKLENHAIYCTPQVGLVEQIRIDSELGWGQEGSAVLVGKHNYPCLVNKKIRCDIGPCELLQTIEQKKDFYRKYEGTCHSVSDAVDNTIPSDGCHHRYSLQQAIHAYRTVMTFQLLMTTLSNPVYGSAWNRPLLIIDEAQDIDNWIRMFYTITLKPKLKKVHDEWDVFWIDLWKEILKFIPYNENRTNISTDWEQHSTQLYDKILPLLKSKPSSLKEVLVNVKDRIRSQEPVIKGELLNADDEHTRNLNKLEKIIQKIGLIADSTTPFVPSPTFRNDNNQIIDYNPKKDQSDLIIDNMSYIPLFVDNFFQKFVNDYDKVLLMGATITDVDLKELGIHDCLSLCPPHSFPVEHRQIFQVFCGNMKYGDDGGETRDKVVVPIMAKKILEIIENIDEKPPFGWKTPVNSIVHCVSGRLQHQFEKLLPNNKTMITPLNDAVLKDKTIQTFKNSNGKILLGSSFMVGYDFPDSTARLNFIPKIPYLPLNDPFINARKKQKDGRQWYTNKAIALLIQASGRTTRSTKDSSYTYILDSGFKALPVAYFPDFFNEAYR